MKEIGLMERNREMEFFIMLMEINIRVCGKMELKKGRDKSFIEMVLNLKVLGITIKHMEKES